MSSRCRHGVLYSSPKFELARLWSVDCPCASRTLARGILFANISDVESVRMA